MINVNKNEVENSPVVNYPPVNSPDQIPPNLTLTQVGIHRGGWPKGGGGFPVTIKSTDHRPTDTPTTFHLPTDTPTGCHHFG